jgi:4-amino-4-deoxy-L-arabinose transferase-like glycosyltransferase
MVDPPEIRPFLVSSRRWPVWGDTRPALYLGIIIVVAAGLRFGNLESTSLWYDEVVTMRVARTGSPQALVERLDQIDGTRAPLHPLALQAWLRTFGPSDAAGRSLSALCGLGAVLVIDRIGRRAFDPATGRWAAWLAAVCPPLVYYSREARMYAWLVFMSCVSWLVFLSFRTTARPAQCVLYGLLLTGLAYSHPLGLFMVAAHGLSYILVRPYLRLAPRWWLAIQAAVVVSIIPWLGRYMDHGTDYPMPRQPIRFLVAVPIEYIGGNSVVLVIGVAIIVFGMLSIEPAKRWPRLALAQPAENLALITWVTAPPLLMYLYSYLWQPIFGPPRYHLFIAPAYLILLAHGLSRLPMRVRWPLVAGSLALSLSLLKNYEQALKADWRGLAAWLKHEESQDRGGELPRPRATIVVYPSDPRFPREQLEAARYYLSPPFRVIPADEQSAATQADAGAPIYEVHCLSKPAMTGTTGPDEPKSYGMSVTKTKR